MEGRPTELTDRPDPGAPSTTGAEVGVRAATFDDVPVLAAIEVAAGERFRSIGMDAVADDDPPAPEVYASAAADGRLWVAEWDGTVVGYALAVELDDGRPHLEQVSVLPAAGGRGVGVALVDAVMSWARGRGGSLTLSTFREVPWNGPWYERLGFTVVAEADLDQPLRAVRDHEAELGLDVSARVIMRRSVPPAPGGKGDVAGG